MRLHSSLLLSLSLLIAPVDATTVIEDKAKLPLKTPSLSQRETLKIRLDNGLEAYIVSDPNSDKSGAMLSVQVGSWEDPKEHPGMAHFLEHMLFLGTKKYPKEGEYQRYIKDHGGKTNAFTANHLTSYIFSVDNNAFDEALDRFSQFFIAPLFNPSGVARELQAIDQEYAKNVENDDIRELYVLKELSKKSHPNHRFNMGSSSTLQNVTQDELKQWYSTHYSANLMRLMIVSPQPIETLKELVVEKFSPIPNIARDKFVEKSSYLDESLLGKMVVIKPIKDKRTLTLFWEMPAKFGEMKQSKPASIICFILGHEGEESLLAQLKRENLAESISCGSYCSGAKKGEITLQIKLTQKGLHETNTVINRIFQTINTFRERGFPRYLFDELRQIQILQYQYESRQELFSTLMSHGCALGEEEISSYPEERRIVQLYDPQAVKELLDYMTPNHALFLLKAPTGTTNFIPDKKEPWLNVPYSVETIDPALLQEWSFAKRHPRIDLPQPNPFLPASLEHLAEDKEGAMEAAQSSKKTVPHPEILKEGPGGIYYWSLDKEYLIPKIAFHIEIKTPKITMADPQTIVMGDFYVKGLNDALIKYSYPAEMAGLTYEVSREDNGISITIYGFSDKAKELLEKIVATIHEAPIDLSKFSTYKDSLYCDYQNFSKESPLAQNLEIQRKILFRHYTTEQDKCAAARKITQAKFKQFAEHLFDETYIESMLYGNIDKEEANSIAEMLSERFNKGIYASENHYKKDIVAIPQSRGPFYLENRTKAQGNAAILAVEYLPFNYKAYAAQDILARAMSEPFFSTLRTKQQTGYIVFNVSKEINGHLFSIFGVQSNTHHPRDLLARFELFIEGFLQELTTHELPEERFHKIRQAAAKDLENPASNLFEMGSLLNNLAFEYNGNFDLIEKRREAIESLDYEEFTALAHEMLGRCNFKRLGLLLKGVTPEEKNLNYQKMRSCDQLKKMCSYQCSTFRA